jgi:hypothetical protein
MSCGTESPFERRIEEFEAEIDFGLGGRQRRGNPHHPFGRTGAHDIGAQPELQRVVGDRIGKRACGVAWAPVNGCEFHPEEQASPAHVADTVISLL